LRKFRKSQNGKIGTCVNSAKPKTENFGLRANSAPLKTKIPRPAIMRRAKQKFSQGRNSFILPLLKRAGGKKFVLPLPAGYDPGCAG
jgi:hypothetical protein